MEISKIGSWTITADGIIWSGQPDVDYLIHKDRLDKAGTGERENTYDWLIHMVEKTWLTRKDIYALNTAFIFALEYFKVGFSKEISFVETFKEQEKELKKKEFDSASFKIAPLHLEPREISFL
jgi:hypothetical protein